MESDEAQSTSGPGKGAIADFDQLIELIRATTVSATWDEVGVPGSVEPLETEVGLVIRKTQEVHDEIADLLVQLRRLQDLQVTIEVRSITLNDNSLSGSVSTSISRSTPTSTGH